VSSAEKARQEKLERAAVIAGTLAAGIELPATPTECKRQFAQVGKSEADIGKEMVELIARANQTIRAANQTIMLCYNNSETIRKSFKGLQVNAAPP
jgi:hypothetical protein